jgi:hypothetical protein
LISAGHSWSDIKQYTLAEVGIFLKAVIRKNRRDYIQNLNQLWYGSNLTQEGIQKAVTELSKEVETEKELEPNEIQAEWRRLASFMSGRK